jgi:hypothetical protein
MWDLSASAEPSLFGMIVEIVGALLLTVEAIGVNKVKHWAARRAG